MSLDRPEIRLIGYADRMTVRPGESIGFHIASRLEGPFQARLVRVICADPNPEGPGMQEEAVTADLAPSYRADWHEMPRGSYMAVPGAEALGRHGKLSLSVTFWPSLPGVGAQALFTLGAADGRRLALQLDGEGRLVFGLTGQPDAQATIETPLRAKQWYRCTAEADFAAGALSLSLEALDTFGLSGDASSDGADLGGSFEIADVTLAALDGPGREALFNGKLEAPELFSNGESLAAWDFAHDMTTWQVPDRGPSGLAGQLMNRPLRGVTGADWTGEEMCWRHRPEHYAAIWFHDDDVGDAGWPETLRLTLPEDLKSGLYALRLSGEGAEDSIPFAVPAPRGKRQADLCVLISTFTFVIYANYVRFDYDEATKQRVRDWGSYPHYPAEHPEYGLSTYNRHSDNSGIALATHLRPIFTTKLGYMNLYDPKGSGLRHLQADTHLLAWLEAKGFSYDVISDHDLDEEGVEAIAGYKALLTGSHPEYHTTNSLDAIQAYRDGGGNLAYLGGNGFYWKIARHPENRDALEVRRAEGGIRAWAAAPGEYYHMFDGSYGGLWRRNGRPPQALAGVGFSSQGLFEGKGYRRMPASYEPRFAWLFEGIEGEEIGTEGFSGGGAAGYELDRADVELGTHPDAVVLARSHDHPDHFVAVPEELLSHVATVSGEPEHDLIRAEILYWETPVGGIVFSTGSITFCGSLFQSPESGGVSPMLERLVERFLANDS